MRHVRGRREKGQALILVIVALAIFLIGALGLAIDASHLYGQRQMAQSAADAAARAANFSIFSKTNTDVAPTNYQNEFGPSNFDCDGTTTGKTPCYFANQGGFSPAAGDTVSVTFPTSVPGVTLSPGWTPGPGAFPAAVQVTIFRTVQTGLMRFLGPSTARVAASATAAIVRVLSPVPILVLHPSLPESFTRGGDSTVTICGGPAMSIQVNSTASNAVEDNGNGIIDLSKAGPNATIDSVTGIPNCDGDGADFGSKGGPSTYPGNLVDGVGQYRSPNGPIYDPLSSVPTPIKPALSLTNLGSCKTYVPGCAIPVPNGVDGCPNSPANPCVLYLPGDYPAGIDAKGQTALFAPGLYYTDSGGFGGSALGYMQMATCPSPAQPTLTPPLPAISAINPDFGCGMMVYNTGNGNKDVFQVGANGDASLLGSKSDGTYLGILFFEDHNSAGHNGVAGAHKLGGGGKFELKGAIYLTNTNQIGPTYQELVLRGSGTNDTFIFGEIIVDVLNLGGNGGIKMVLDPNLVLPVDQVALVR